MPAPSTPQSSRHANNDHLTVSSSHSSHTLSPHTPRASTSTSSVTTPSSGRPSLPVSLDTVLAAHANAPDPIRAALEHLIADRNSVAAQNSQLWKLIEKQRSATTQLNRDNDRIRTEREAYKSKLSALGENTDAILKAFKGERHERHGKPSSSTSRSNSSPNPRATLVRHQSDEPSTFSVPSFSTFLPFSPSFTSVHRGFFCYQVKSSPGCASAHATVDPIRFVQ